MSTASPAPYENQQKDDKSFTWRGEQKCSDEEYNSQELNAPDSAF